MIRLGLATVFMVISIGVQANTLPATNSEKAVYILMTLKADAEFSEQFTAIPLIEVSNPERYWVPGLGWAHAILDYGADLFDAREFYVSLVENKTQKGVTMNCLASFEPELQSERFAVRISHCKLTDVDGDSVRSFLNRRSIKATY